MDIRATYTLDPAHLQRALRRRHRLFTVTMPVLAAVFILQAVLTHRGSDVPVAVILLVFPPALFWVTRTSIRRSLRSLGGGQEVRLTEEALTIRTATAEGSIRWEAFADARLVADMWLLRQHSRALTPIPATAFHGEDRAAVAEFFARRLPPRSRFGRRAG